QRRVESRLAGGNRGQPPNDGSSHFSMRPSVDVPLVDSLAITSVAPGADEAEWLLSTKVLGAKQGANVDIGIGEARILELLHPLGGTLERLHLPEPAARDDFLGLRKWAVGHDAILTREAYALGKAGRLQSPPVLHHARLDQGLVVCPHR